MSDDNAAATTRVFWNDDYTRATTRVFWDVHDFPIPADRWKSLQKFPKNIRHALEIEGYYHIDELSIHAYDDGDMSYRARCHYRCAGVQFTQQAKKKTTRLNRMLIDMIEWAYENPPTRMSQEVNLLVITKDIPDEDTELVNVLEELQRRKCNVFFVVPDDCPPEQVPPPTTASLVWRWTNLFDGKFPIESDTDSDDDKV